MPEPNWHILEGDCLTRMREIPSESIHTCVTSPPYYGLRDYGVEGQMGLESVPDCAGWATGESCGVCYVCKMIAVFREVRRVLRNDGTLWLNLGDSYAAGGRGGNTVLGENQASAQKLGPRKIAPGLKPKDMIGIPWRVGLALQADGWYLRMDNIWHKENPMPESVTDRPTKAHEYVLLLSKSASYYYDSESIREARVSDTNSCGKNSRANVDRVPRLGELKQDRIGKGTYTGFNDRWQNKPTDQRNKRSVWTVAPSPYKGAHFATYPPELIRPCILAGAPIGGVVFDPFTGSGTTAEVALLEDRQFIGCELNHAYITLAERRIRKALLQPRLFTGVSASPMPSTIAMFAEEEASHAR